MTVPSGVFFGEMRTISHNGAINIFFTYNMIMIIINI